MRILFVDDSKIQLELAQRVVSDMDPSATLVLCNSVKEAIREMAKNPKFDVVVTDYFMIGENGTDVAKMIKHLGFKIPVVLLTGRKKSASKAADFKLFDKIMEKSGEFSAWGYVLDNYKSPIG